MIKIINMSLLTLQFLVLLVSVSVSSQQVTINDFFKSYDGSLWPTYFTKETTNVDVNLYINAISSVSATSMDFIVDMYLRQNWTDPRLKALPKSIGIKQLIINNFDIAKKIWKPDLFFRNLKSGYYHNIVADNMYVRIQDDGQVLYSIRLTVRLACSMNLVDYPLDIQDCYMKASSYSYTMDMVNLRWAAMSEVDYDENMSIPQFKILAIDKEVCHEKYSTGEFSCILLKFLFDRENGYHIIQTYLPTILIVMISWVSFWLDPLATPARVTLGVTTLLTLTTLASGVRASLPPVSYIKAIDVWVGTCLIFVFSALLEFTISNYLATRRSVSIPLCSCLGKVSKDSPQEQRTARAIKLDRVCRVMFPTCFLVFNLVYWPYYKIYN